MENLGLEVEDMGSSLAPNQRQENIQSLNI